MDVGRTGAPISTAESRKETHLGLSSNPVAPTFFRNEPSGEHVEGLSYLRDESYAVECAARTHDFENSTLCVVVGGKPLLAKRLRAPRLPFPKEASLAIPPFSAGRSRATQMEALLGRIA